MDRLNNNRHTSVTALVIIAFLPLLVNSQQQQQGPLLNANQFMKELQFLANKRLGVQEMQEHFDALSFAPQMKEGRELVTDLKNTLDEKFLERVNALRKIKVAVEGMYEQPQGTFEQCCQVDLSDQEFNSRYGKKLNPNTVCTRISPNAEPDSRHFSNEVVEVMKENFRKIPTLKWQYFNSEEGVFTIYPANKLDSCTDGYDGRFRPWYVETVSPEPKNLVVVIDKSASMKEKFGSKTLMQIAIESAITVLDTLNPGDKVGVVTFSSEANTLGSRKNDEDHLHCFTEQLAQATLANTNFLKDYISSLRPAGDTQYRSAFETAFSLLKQSYNSSSTQSQEQVILFMTDGEPTDSKTDIMREIKMNNEQMGNSVVILTVGLGTRSGLDFLKDIANQNYTAHGVGPPNTAAGDIRRGQYTHVLDYTKLRNTMGRYYDFFANTENLGHNPVFSVPYQDAFGLGLMTTAAIPVKHNGVLKGAVGTDFTIDDLLAEITYFKQGQKSYSFIYEVNTHAEGRAVMHPLLPAPTRITDDPVHVHITSLEREEEFFKIVYRNSTNGQDSGETSFVSRRSLPRGNAEREGVYITSVESTYYWRYITGSPYVLCLVRAVNDRQFKLRQQRPTGKDFLYHRIDITSPPSSCRHANRHATQDQSVVKYAPKAFSDPVEYLELEEDITTIQHYSDYMNDATWSVTNKHFSDDVKDMTTATSKVNVVWQTNKTHCDDFTLYRYIGTTNGVFRIYPGVVMNKRYDPTMRPWFERAKSNKGILTLSVPYEDASGAGYIITLSKTIVSHDSVTDATSDAVLAVMGLDFTQAYFYHLLTKDNPMCTEGRYRCFVMDTSGYLIVHEDFFGDEQIDVEYLHITEKEPNVAEDLIEDGILTWTACKDFRLIRDYHYYTVQPLSRQYLINKLDNPDDSKRYQLAYVEGSNVYIGMVDTSATIFRHPCNCYYDRCLDSSCQCPCLSLSRYEYCNDKYLFINEDDPACTPGSPSLSPVVEELDAYEGLDYCCEVDCTHHLSFRDCSRFVSCTWDEEAEICEGGTNIDKSKSMFSLGLIIGGVIGAIVLLVIVVLVVLKVVRRAGSSSPHQETLSSRDSQQQLQPPGLQPDITNDVNNVNGDYIVIDPESRDSTYSVPYEQSQITL